MTYVVYRPNPLDRNEDSNTFVGECGTIRKALEARFPGFTEFSEPTLVLVGGVPRLRATWDGPLRPADVVEVVTVPAGIATTILTALTISTLLVSAYAVYKMSNLHCAITCRYGQHRSLPSHKITLMNCLIIKTP